MLQGWVVNSARSVRDVVSIERPLHCHQSFYYLRYWRASSIKKKAYSFEKISQMSKRHLTSRFNAVRCYHLAVELETKYEKKRKQNGRNSGGQGCWLKTIKCPLLDWLLAHVHRITIKRPNKKETTHTKVNSFVFLHEASPYDLWLQTFCRHKHTMPHKIVGVCIFTCPFTSSWLVYECHFFVESVTAAAKKSNTTRNTCLDSGPRDFPSRNRN